MASRNIPVLLMMALLGLPGCPATSTPGGAPGPQPLASSATAPLASRVEFASYQVPAVQTPPSEASCVPATCEFFVASCGELSDGCGGTLRCGTCAAGQTCGGDGLANVCSARARVPSVQWLEVLPSGVFGLATGKESSVFLIRQSRRNNVVTLLGAEGNERWSRNEVAPHVNFSGLSVAASGELLAWGRHEAGGGTGASVYRFDTHGTVLGLGNPDHLPEQVLQDADGNLLDYDNTHASAFVRYRPHHGQGWVLRSTPRWAYPPVEAWDPFHYQAIALDPRGGAFVAGSTQGQGTILGKSVGQPGQSSPFVLKVSPEGTLLRAWELPDTEAALRLIGASASGALVGQGHYVGRLRWAGGVLSSGDTDKSRPFLMSLDPQGRLSWVRPLPWPLDAGYLAVSAEGKIAVVNGFNQTYGREAYASAVHVRVYDAQGNLEWSRTFSPTDTSGSVFVGGVDWAGEQLVLGGSFYGSVDFGTGVQQSPTGPAAHARGFVLKLR